MFKFIAFMFLMFLLLLTLMGFSIVRSFKRMLFGGGDSNKQRQQQRTNANTNRQSNRQQYASSRANESNVYQQHRKVYGQDEGEYVDYEEVK